jgi:hypothetical protein
VVKANVFGDWAPSSEIAKFYNELDGHTTHERSFTFTAPSSAGNYSLRLIWAYDAFGYSNYDMSNMPTNQQCETWGDSHTPYLDCRFEVEGPDPVCTNYRYHLTEGGNQSSLMKVLSADMSPSQPAPGENVTATIRWQTFGGGGNIVHANAFGNWSPVSEIAKFYNGLDGHTIRERTISFTAPSSPGNYCLRLIWAYDAFGYSSYSMGNMPTEQQCDTWGDSHTPYFDFCFDVDEPIPVCTNYPYSLTVGGNQTSLMKVLSAEINPPEPSPGQSVTMTIKWETFGGGGNIVHANAFGDWAPFSEIDRFYSGLDGHTVRKRTITFSAPSSQGYHSVRLIWAYDAFGYSSYSMDNMPTRQQCETWGDSHTPYFDFGFQVGPDIPACRNYEYPLTIGGNQATLMKVHSVQMSPSEPSPGQSLSVTVRWETFGGGGNIVKANVFGDWAPSSEITRFYSGLDGHTIRERTFTVTAPSSSGAYSLRLIWAYDAFGYSNYDMRNMPTDQQCETWGNSHTPFLDVDLRVR